MADIATTSRTVLIVGAILGLAGVGFGVMTMNSSQSKPVSAHIGGKKADVAALTAAADAAQAEVKRQRTLADVAPEGATANGKPRVMPFFFSTELWQIPPQGGGNMHDVVDIYDPTVEPIHKGIPNAWFLQYGLLDALSMSDGDAQDSDKDGFSNREEFEAETDPSQSSSLPPLVQAEAGKPVKLEVVSVDRSNAVITVDSMFATDPAPESAGVKIFRRADDRQPIAKYTLKAGDNFELEQKDKCARFTVVGFEKKDFADSMGRNSSENVIRVRDNDALTDADREFTVRAGRPKSKDRDFGTPNGKGHAINDVSARLRVTAGPKAGQEDGTIRVALHSDFKVPGDENVSCRLESVDADGSANILPQGAQSPVHIPAAAK